MTGRRGVEYLLAPIEKGQQMGGHQPTPDDLNRARRILLGEITLAQANAEVDAIYRQDPPEDLDDEADGSERDMPRLEELLKFPSPWEQDTRPVVIAPTHDGFHLSDEAVDLLRGRGHERPEELARDHEDLVEVVRVLGPDAGGVSPRTGARSTLVTVNVPADVDIVICDYDGAEWVAELHRRWDYRGEVPADARPATLNERVQRWDHARHQARPVEEGSDE